MTTQKKEIGLTCKLYSVLTKNIVSVFIKDINRYAILKKDNDGQWWLTSFRFRRLFTQKTIQQMTSFKKPIRFWNNHFIFLRKRSFTFVSRRALSLYKKIAYADIDSEGFGQIPKKFLITQTLPAIT